MTSRTMTIPAIAAVVAALIAPVAAARAGGGVPTCKGHPATIVGTEGDDLLVGTPGDDVIVGLGGRDEIYGEAGSDIICGGKGRDEIHGGPGRDVLIGNSGHDLLYGDKARDRLKGGPGFDGLAGRGGLDRCKTGEYFSGCERPLSVSFDPLGATIPEIQAALEAGTITSVGLVDFYLARIDAYDRSGPKLKAMLALNDDARSEAAALDAERASTGPRGPLHGIPIVLKDNMGTDDLPTTAGSLSLEGFIPVADAFQVARLRDAGAIILGKTNLHEFARDITTVSSLGGQTRNPYDPARYPGGSSGGTGAAIAAEFAAVGMGTDTCGSIRIPSAFNDLYGLRPTIGLSSRTGVIPLTWTEDTAGPMARSVVDLAIVLDATVGYDPADPASVASAFTYLDDVDSDGLTGMRIGVLDVLFAGAYWQVDGIVRAALDEMGAHGATVVPAVIADFNALRGNAAPVFLQEFKFALDDYLAGQPGSPMASLQVIYDSGLYHPSLQARLAAHLAVTTLDTAEYEDAVARRDIVRDAIVAYMDDNDLDALAYPTITQLPALIGYAQTGSNCGTASVGGLPAIVVPAGFTSGGLPVGLELMGRPFSEETLIRIAAGYEANTDHRALPDTTPALP